MSVLKSLFAAVDQAFAEVSELHPDEVRCGKGCDDCCHGVFDVSLVEAVNLLKQVKQLNEELQLQVRQNSEKALADWLMFSAGDTIDPALVRVRCPLLNDNGQCLCHDDRPFSCRANGIPAEFNGAGHVCGLSGFDSGKSYPTVNLQHSQDLLYQLSVARGGKELGGQRWFLAEILLGDEKLEALVS